MALLCYGWGGGGLATIFTKDQFGNGFLQVLLAARTWVFEEVGRESEEPVSKFLNQLWRDEQGQDIAEYAVMLAVILVIVVGTIRLIGSNANNVFSQVGSSIQ
jgi:Flp pilus assembly pilin Flp